MKDIQFVITAKRQRAELRIGGVCLAIAFLLNILSIVVYNTEWVELFTQLPWVVCLGAGMYGLTLFVRLIYELIRWGLRGK